MASLLHLVLAVSLVQAAVAAAALPIARAGERSRLGRQQLRIPTISGASARLHREHLRIPTISGASARLGRQQLRIPTISGASDRLDRQHLRIPTISGASARLDRERLRIPTISGASARLGIGLGAEDFVTHMGHISYGALHHGAIPCSIPGHSYFANCRAGAAVNPYRRGCNSVKHCRT